VLVRRPLDERGVEQNRRGRVDDEPGLLLELPDGGRPWWLVGLEEPRRHAPGPDSRRFGPADEQQATALVDHEHAGTGLRVPVDRSIAGGAVPS
jgi:hypothetical protein